MPSGEWLRAIGRIFRLYLPLSHLVPSMIGLPSSYRVHVWCARTRTARLQSREGRTMTESIVSAIWSTWQTDRHTDRQPCHHSTCLGYKCIRRQNAQYHSKIMYNNSQWKGLLVATSTTSLKRHTCGSGVVQATYVTAVGNFTLLHSARKWW